MMKKLSKFYCILFGLILIFFTACNSDNKQTFQQIISVRCDTLKIDNTKDTLIFGQKGTALFFEKESFQLPDGNTPAGKISILLKECYSTLDIIGENLSTTADGKLLETRGMINVTAFSNNQELKLKKGSKFIVHFHKDTSEREKQMNLFYGNATANGTTNWKLDSATLLKPAVPVSVPVTSGSRDTLQNNAGFDSKIFNQKYSAFKKSAITSMDELELNYYIFSATKLGWINCDFFWEVTDEKIDYYVKCNVKLKANINIVFKQAKSIMRGIPEGDKIVFRNAPINQEIKIVAIAFEGNKPLMAVTNTKTGKRIFDKLTYKPFTLNDLEKEINNP